MTEKTTPKTPFIIDGENADNIVDIIKGHKFKLSPSDYTIANDYAFECVKVQHENLSKKVTSDASKIKSVFSEQSSLYNTIELKHDTQIRMEKFSIRLYNFTGILSAFTMAMYSHRVFLPYSLTVTEYVYSGVAALVCGYGLYMPFKYRPSMLNSLKDTCKSLSEDVNNYKDNQKNILDFYDNCKTLSVFNQVINNYNPPQFEI